MARDPERRRGWRGAALGAAAGAVGFTLCVAVHGGVRAERGCVVDSPVYELVNGPTMALAALGVPVRPEGIGEARPPWVRPAGPRFSAAVVLGSGALAYALLGLAAGLVAARHRRAGAG